MSHLVRRISLLLVVCVMGLAGLFLWLGVQARPVSAQTDLIFVDKRLGRPSPVVYIGEYITFTIFIENRSTFTVTTLPLSDTFNSAVLGYVDAVPAPDSVDVANSRLDWNDLTTTFGDLGPGESIQVVVGFIAEHPAPAVVNRAAVHDAEHSAGGIPGSGSESGNGEAIGGASPVDKNMVDGITPTVGLPITFTIAITNDGYTTMTVVPLVEDYDPAYLQYSSAVPAPDSIDEVTGELQWSDLTLFFGDIPAHEVITVEVVFIALQDIALTTNHASVVGAKDYYDNDLAPGDDEVPIMIIGAPGQVTATPAPAPTSTPAGPTPVAPTATPAATSTPAVLPAQIPDTGFAPDLTPILAVVIFLLPLAAWGLWRFARK